MSIVYYAQIDIICLIILAIVYFTWNYGNKTLNLQYRLFNMLIALDATFCVADAVAWATEGKSALIMRFLAYASNELYFLSVIWLACVWNLVIQARTERIDTIRCKRVLYVCIPAVIFTIVAFINPFTNWIFTMTEDNVYVRGPLLFVHWAVAFVYIVYAEYVLYVASKNTTSYVKKDAYKLCSGFSVVCFALALPQFIFYGLVTAEVGITLAILFLFARTQMSMVRTDPLTGVQNRRGLMQYIDALVSRNAELHLSAIMIDINDFKQINDVHSHIVGDRVLRDIAVILRDVCTEISTKCCLCRYGGDEFLIICEGYTQEDIDSLIRYVNDSLKTKHDVYGFDISVSSGIAHSDCKEAACVEKLINLADAAMYEEKNRYRNRKK